MWTKRFAPLAAAPLILLFGCEEGTQTSFTTGTGGGTGGASDATTDAGSGGAKSTTTASTSTTTGVGGHMGTGPTGLHAMGSKIVDGNGNVIVLHGVNRSGTEYQCTKAGAGSYFDGPSSAQSVQVMTTWPNVNAVRIPLNEGCWLGLNGEPLSGTKDGYKTAIQNYVSVLHSYSLIPILELHWVGPGTSVADRQQPMPGDHSADFWTDVATTFKDDDGVVFEPFNEPFPGGNRDDDNAWKCWSDGCTANQSVPQGQPAATYPAVGMKALVQAIRAVDNGKHLVLLGGIQFSNALTQWLTYAPTTDTNIGAAWHVYSFNSCIDEASCWSMAPAMVGASVPLVATEIGERDCGGVFINPLMAWLDGKGASYLAWTWDVYGTCAPYVSQSNQGRPYSLITDYTSGMPNGGFAQAFHDHLAGLKP